MDHSQAGRRATSLGSICSCKTGVKFCLLYFTTLLVLTIIYTALNNEPLDSSETVWWWVFLTSLILIAAAMATLLIFILYIDCSRVEHMPNPIQDAEISSSSRPQLSRIPESNSTSFKTIMTIDSKIHENFPFQSALAQQQQLQQQLTQQQLFQQPTVYKSPPDVKTQDSGEKNPITSVVDATGQKLANESPANKHASGPKKLTANPNDRATAEPEHKTDSKKKKKKPKKKKQLNV